jgi:(1->4)-alpha-D-glucan 1-alpha-D-glucosylmutase
LATHRFLAQTPSALMMLQIEDTLGEVEQVNLPGTVDQHPNWRRKLPYMIDDLGTLPMLRQLSAVLNEAGRDWRRSRR